MNLYSGLAAYGGRTQRGTDPLSELRILRG